MMDNEVGVTSPESTTQILTSFEEYTLPVTYLEEVEKTLGTLIEVEPLNKTKLEESILRCKSRRRNRPEPPVKPHILDNSRMKVVDYLTTQTPPLPHVANSHPKGVYSYYNPGIDDPKRHYGFKLSLLRKSVSLGVDISNWEMFDDDWRLESKEVSPLGEELSLFDRPNKVKRCRILEAHHLESILQQQISQRMAPSRYDGTYRYYHLYLNSSVGEPSPLYVK
uniref:Ribonuclease H-like domain-containing protein n=1 Tax=Tanacetum cinerariifolium TaxID=118510 RepID=A0A699HEL7_TANCI|nr:ribonuclease H-like domain-containing protein [Tanacetum cinerariifolium]